MDIIDSIKLIDTNLFLFLNGLNNSFFDAVMFAVSDKLMWIPFYISVIFITIKYWKREAGWIVLALILCIVISDQVASGVIKGLVQRPRPSHATDLVGLVHLVNGYTGGRFGFVSSHAANAVGFALLSSLLFKNKKYTLIIFSWAALTAYSRIYLGVHYPLDIIGGTLVGVFSALLCFWLIQKLRPSLLLPQKTSNSTAFANTQIPISTLSLTFIFIIILAFTKL